MLAGLIAEQTMVSVAGRQGSVAKLMGLKMKLMGLKRKLMGLILFLTPRPKVNERSESKRA
jgi:hypothetical protein